MGHQVSDDAASPTRVLVVEPDPAERARLIAACERVAAALARPVIVDSAGDGTTAFAIWAERRPKLVVSEVLLEGLSGLALLRRIVADDGNARGEVRLGARRDPELGTCVVFVSTMARESDRYWGLRQGAVAYLGKPTTDAAIEAAIHRALTEGRRGRQLRP
ncbi:MAG: response regulator [Deltaproteobacteria bacterium]|nr:response regulator [Nannocystaceae bacterium]